jgi:hypothetical protein
VALIAGPIITQPPFVEPDCHDHFQPIFQHNHLCRASLGLLDDQFSSLKLLVLMSFLRLLDLLSLLEPLDGRLPIKRSKGIMEINSLKRTKKTLVHLLLDPRHIERMQPDPTEHHLNRSAHACLVRNALLRHGRGTRSESVVLLCW